MLRFGKQKLYNFWFVVLPQRQSLPANSTKEVHQLTLGQVRVQPNSIRFELSSLPKNIVQRHETGEYFV